VSGKERQVIKTKLKQLGDQNPDCPKCGMGNAMLDQRGWLMGNTDPTVSDFVDLLKCRDCGHVVKADEVDIAIIEPKKEVWR
jgi:predicted Zn-ribbon and HTH transcriptional regulator